VIQRNRIHCTVGERLILHLLDYNKYCDQWDVPFALTQDGIALHVGVMRSAVAREISKLKPLEMLEETSKHVAGKKRKRKTYFLTEKGTKVALEIKERLSEEAIALPEEDGPTEIMFKEIPGKFDLSSAEIVRFISGNRVFDREGALEYIGSRGGVVDIEEIEEDLPPGELRSLELSDRVPTIRHFFGRTKEVQSVQDAIDSEVCKMIVVQGMAGIGKTTLTAKLINDNKGEHNIFWYSFGRWNSFRNIMIPLSDFLKGRDKPRLSSYLRTGRDFEFGHFLNIVVEEAQDANIIMVFDNFHYADEKTRKFFASLVEVMQIVRGSSLIVISRHIPEFYNRSHVKVKGIVGEFRLEGLDEESCAKILKERDMDTDGSSEICSLTGGHPLTLELLDSYENIGEQSDIRQFLEEEVRREISDPEAKLLGIASVYRYPVESHAFFLESEPETDYDALSQLCRRSLVREPQENRYDVHDLVKEFFYNRLTPAKRSEYHRSAAQYYSNKTTELSTIEMMHHLIQAGDIQETVGIALEEGPGLLYKGYVEFVNILEQLPDDAIQDEQKDGIAALREDAQTRMGGLG